MGGSPVPAGRPRTVRRYRGPGRVRRLTRARGNDAPFELENSKLLDVSLDGTVMAKAGTMVGYTGDVPFERKSAGGLTGTLKSKATGEGVVTMEATGSGSLYLADRGKEGRILELDADDAISVNGNDVLAFESGVGRDVRTLNGVAGASTGGPFNVYLDGPATSPSPRTASRSSSRRR